MFEILINRNTHPNETRLIILIIDVSRNYWDVHDNVIILSLNSPLISLIFLNESKMKYSLDAIFEQASTKTTFQHTITRIQVRRASRTNRLKTETVLD